MRLWKTVKELSAACRQDLENSIATLVGVGLTIYLLHS